MRISNATKTAMRIVTHPISFYRYLFYSLKLYHRNEVLQLTSGGESDKGLPGHGYARVYNYFFNDRRNIEHLCEIGLLRKRKQQRFTQKGSRTITPSLHAWKTYFPKAHIVGFDIESFVPPKDERVTIVTGDQSKRDDLQKIVIEHPQYDVIIDDGPHLPIHQQTSFSFLFPHVKPGGLYIIEDLQAVPNKGIVQDSVPMTIELLKKFQWTGQWESLYATDSEKEVIESEIDTIYVFDSLKRDNPKNWADSIAVIVKKQ